MNRIEEINNELKIIKECEAAHRFLIGIQANGGESESAFISWSNRMNNCAILDSSIDSMESLKLYKQKLISERSNLKNNETKARFEKWLTINNYNKFMSILKKKYGKNITLGFNKFVEEL